jgi:hypothetical protein
MFLRNIMCLQDRTDLVPSRPASVRWSLIFFVIKIAPGFWQIYFVSPVFAINGTSSLNISYNI